MVGRHCPSAFSAVPLLLFLLLLSLATLPPVVQGQPYDACSICFNGYDLTKPDAILVKGRAGVVAENSTCSTIESNAQSGMYRTIDCVILRARVGNICGCIKRMPTISPAPTTAMPTSSPINIAITTTEPTPAPTISAAGTAMPTTAAPIVMIIPTTSPTTSPTLAPDSTTVAPTTNAPAITTTVAPTTVAPATTTPPTTLTPDSTTTVAPTMLAPAITVAPTTEAPAATVAPTTLAPASTVAPTTLAPATTVAPTTGAPATTKTATPSAAPVTEAPVVGAPQQQSIEGTVLIRLNGITTLIEEKAARSAYDAACTRFYENQLGPAGYEDIDCQLVDQQVTNAGGGAARRKAYSRLRRSLQDAAALDTTAQVTATSNGTATISEEDFVANLVQTLSTNADAFVETLRTEGGQFFADLQSVQASDPQDKEPTPGPTPTDAPDDDGSRDVAANDDDDNGLSAGAVAGIVIGVIAGLGCVCLGAYYVKKNAPPGSPRRSISHITPIEEDAEETPPAKAFSAAPPPPEPMPTQATGKTSIASFDNAKSLERNIMSRTVIAPPLPKLGIVIDTSMEGPVIHKVKAGSPLEGLLFPGDIIVACDDVDTRAMSATAITSLMARTSDYARKLTILSEDVSDVKENVADAAIFSERPRALPEPAKEPREPSTVSVPLNRRNDMVSRLVVAPPGKLGITIVTSEEGPIIKSVNPMSPLAGNLFPGDVIVAVDDVDTRLMSSSAITAHFVSTVGKTRKLTVLSADVTEESVTDSAMFSQNLGGEDDNTPQDPPEMQRQPEEPSTGNVPLDMRENMISRTVVAPPGKLGITIETSREGPIIQTVNPASHLAGNVFPGDIIVAIDDVDTRFMSSSAIIALLVDTAGKSRKLKVISEDVTN